METKSSPKTVTFSQNKSEDQIDSIDIVSPQATDGMAVNITPQRRGTAGQRRPSKSPGGRRDNRVSRSDRKMQ